MKAPVRRSEKRTGVAGSGAQQRDGRRRALLEADHCASNSHGAARGYPQLIHAHNNGCRIGTLLVAGLLCALAPMIPKDQVSCIIAAAAFRNAWNSLPHYPGLPIHYTRLNKGRHLAGIRVQSTHFHTYSRSNYQPHSPSQDSIAQSLLSSNLYLIRPDSPQNATFISAVAV